MTGDSLSPRPSTQKDSVHLGGTGVLLQAPNGQCLPSHAPSSSPAQIRTLMPTQRRGLPESYSGKNQPPYCRFFLLAAGCQGSGGSRMLPSASESQIPDSHPSPSIQLAGVFLPYAQMCIRWGCPALAPSLCFLLYSPEPLCLPLPPLFLPSFPLSLLPSDSCRSGRLVGCTAAPGSSREC